MTTLKNITAAQIEAAEQLRRLALQIEKYGTSNREIALSIDALRFRADSLTVAAQIEEPTDNDMRAFSASDVACSKWPEDTLEHKALRSAYLEGAANYDNATIERCAQVVEKLYSPCNAQLAATAIRKLKDDK